VIAGLAVNGNVDQELGAVAATLMLGTASQVVGKTAAPPRRSDDGRPAALSASHVGPFGAVRAYLQAFDGSDGTRTRDLRRDRPVLRTRLQP
jgi:hypothetical protein